MIAMLPLTAIAQNPQPFVLNSKLGNLNAPAKAYLIYQLGANRVIDSAAITNGSFVFKGNVMNPTNAYLVIDHKGVGLDKLDSAADVLTFFVDKGEIAINGPDSVSKAKINGSPINDDNIKLTAQLKRINDKALALQKESNDAPPAQKSSEAFKSAEQAKFKALQLEYKSALKTFIKANPNSYLSLLALNDLSKPTPDPTELDPLYTSLSQNIKDTEGAKVFKRSLDAVRTTAIGVIAPDFTQADVNGVPVKLSSFRGKYVLIDFWASWCGPCRQENPNVVKTYAKYKNKNFTIIGVSLDKAEGKSAWLDAIKSDGLTWTQVSDLKFWQNDVARLYSIGSIPSNILVDPTGKILAKDLRGDDLDNKLAEIFGKM
jgi:thiol-disulfide isomerase/thioredoxin